MNSEGFFSKIVSGEIPQAPITKHLGWKFISFDEATSTLEVEMLARPEFVNPAGAVHGGMLAAMLDETLSPAVAATLGPGEFAPTLEIKVSFVAPAGVGSIFGTARVVSRGRSICFAEGRLRDAYGNLIATASATSKIGRMRLPDASD